MIRPGEMVSYATVMIQSHGFMVHANEKFSYPAIVSTGVITLEGTPSELSIPETEFEKLIIDTRAVLRSGGNFVMVYRAGKTEAEVHDMLRPQIREWLKRHIKAYQTLADNANEMVESLDKGLIEHTCKPMAMPEEPA